MTTEGLELLAKVTIKEVVIISLLLIALYKFGEKVVKFIENWHDRRTKNVKNQLRLEEIATQSEILKAGMLELLRYRFYRECEKRITKGFATTSDLEDLDKMYKAYRGLGGNGTGDSLYKKVNALPMESEE